MDKDVTILVADDDEGHAGLIVRNLNRAGVSNAIERFRDGQEILDFLFRKGEGKQLENDTSYILLLDIRMPKVNGIEVLRQIKADSELKKLPVIMVTTTDDPKEVSRCHELGCSSYITKPVEYDAFVNAVQNLGLYLTVVEVPSVKETEK